jgi:hypothetical protein
VYGSRLWSRPLWICWSISVSLPLLLTDAILSKRERKQRQVKGRVVSCATKYSFFTPFRGKGLPYIVPSSVVAPDPGYGAFLTPGSGIRDG